jgi:hypothetical protein
MGTSPTPRTPYGWPGFGTSIALIIAVEAGRHAIIQQTRVEQVPLLVIDVLFVQSPAHPLRHAALHLSLDIARMNRRANVLHRRVAQNLHLAGLGVNFHVHDVRGKGRPPFYRFDGRARHDGAAQVAQPGGELANVICFPSVANTPFSP